MIEKYSKLIKTIDETSKIVTRLVQNVKEKDKKIYLEILDQLLDQRITASKEINNDKL